jgi:hypothetical protein
MFKHVRRHRGGGPRRTLALAAIAGLGAMVLGAVPGIRLAHAASATVTNCNDSGAGSLRAAVGTAGVTSITFSVFCRPSSPIVLTSGPIDIETNLTINGGSAALEAVSGNFTSRVFNVGFTNPAATVTIRNLTIENGVTSFAADGGGIRNMGALTVIGSTFTGNTAPSGQGGAIANLGALTVASSTFRGNTAGFGGAISQAVQSSTVVMNISGSFIIGNTATVFGGAIFNFATAKVTGTTINGNSARFAGGNVWNFGTMTLSGDTVNANVAPFPSDGGGGVWNGGRLTLTSTTLGGNTANQGGGLFNDCGATAVLTSDTVTNNTATGGAGSGGGIFNNGGILTLVGATNAVANNTPDNIATGVGCGG